MKRRYKEGDWIRVPLGEEYDAVGIIARACRSRLFGYFFGIEAGSVPSHDALKRLRPEHAAACALFGGASLEESRWRVVAASLPFEREAWPLPAFASRGAFGRTWTRRVYDPDTMQVVHSEPMDERAAQQLPDARFATASDLETLLRLRLCGIAPEQPLTVYHARFPLAAEALDVLVRGGRLQFGEMPGDRDAGVLAEFFAAHPGVELRVYGFSAQPFDMNLLRRLPHLRSLAIEARTFVHPHALRSLRDLRSLRIGPSQSRLSPEDLAALPELRALEVHGSVADAAAIAACRRLESLALIDVPGVDLAALAAAARLREIAIAYALPDLAGIAALPRLRRLEIRSVRLDALPDLASNRHLECVALRGVAMLHDLTPLAGAPSLRELHVENMPQLHVWTFEPLRGGKLRRAAVDVGSKGKSREIYRLLRAAPAAGENEEHEVRGD